MGTDTYQVLQYLCSVLNCRSIVRKTAKIRNQYNQVPHLTQDTIWESDKITIRHHKHQPRGQILQIVSHCLTAWFKSSLDKINWDWRRETGLSSPVKYFTDRSKGVLFLWIICVCVCVLCFSCIRVCSLQPCGHLLGKGCPLGSCWWCLLYFCYFPMWYPWSGVVLDCIISWSCRLSSFFFWIWSSMNDPFIKVLTEFIKGENQFNWSSRNSKYGKTFIFKTAGHTLWKLEKISWFCFLFYAPPPTLLLLL